MMMNWKRFLDPTIGKLLVTAFFMLVPIPLPQALASQLQAKYMPILYFPFTVTGTVGAYVSVVLIFCCFYVLSSLISHVYHKHVLADRRKGDWYG